MKAKVARATRSVHRLAKILAVTAAVPFLLAAAGWGQSPTRVLFDLGSSAKATPSPIDGFHWNNVTSFSPGLKVTNAVSADGQEVGIAFRQMTPFYNMQTYPAIACPYYPSNAAVDGFFLGPWTNAASIRIEGLQPAKTYEFAFFGSFWPNTPTSVTSFAIGDITQTVVTTRNTDRIASIPGITGTTSVVIRVQGMPTNGILNVLEIRYDMPYPRPDPAIAVYPAELANSAVHGADAPAQVIEVWNSGGGALDYSIATNVPWLCVSPASGSNTGEVPFQTMVAYNTETMAPGVYTGELTIVSEEATNSPVTVAVTLGIGASADETPPSVPGNLRVLGRTASTVEIAWDPSTDDAGVEAYEVELNGATAGAAAGTVFTNCGLTAGTVYTNRVRARDAVTNWSDWSVELEVAPMLGAVAAPSITPDGGTFTGSVNVTMGCDTEDAEIRFTVNGGDATESDEVYDAPFLLTNSATVRARG